MANIRIEEKKSGGGSILPWILGLLLLALVIWGIAEAFEETDEEVLTEEVVEDDEAYVAPVATDVDNDMEAVEEYMTFTENMDGEMSLDHEFSHEALTKLTAATMAVAREKNVMTDAQIREKTDRAKQLADDIMKDPMAGDHADNIKMSAMMIVEMMEDIDQNANNGMLSNDLDQLRQEAQAISDETLALNQKGDIRGFFRQARNILEQMS